jgi:hypothetical protein
MKQLSGFLFIYIFTIGLQSKAELSCISYLSETPFGEVYSWFNHNQNYTVELPQLTIKDQCAIGHCHLYSWISELESRSGIALSNAYIDAMSPFINTAWCHIVHGQVKLILFPVMYFQN